MSDQKQSQFIEVQTLTDSDYVPVFGQSSNRKISKPNLFDQIKDETQIFIYPTTEQLQSANLVADETWPIYVRNEETEYRLYKITSIAAGVDDISLDNGLTATFQEEYSDVGFVVGPATSTDNAIAVFDGAMGTQLKNGPVIGSIGENLIEASTVTDTSYIKINPDESVSLRNTSQFQTDLGIDLKVTGPASVLDGVVALFDGVTGKLVKAGDTIANYLSAFLVTLYSVFPRKINTWADIAATPVVAAGQIFDLLQHTSGGVGGGRFRAVAGSVSDNGGTQKNSGTPGFYLERIRPAPSVTEISWFNPVYTGGDDSWSKLVAAYNATPDCGQLNLDAGTTLNIGGPLVLWKKVAIEGFSKENTKINFISGVYLAAPYKAGIVGLHSTTVVTGYSGDARRSQLRNFTVTTDGTVPLLSGIIRSTPMDLYNVDMKSMTGYGDIIAASGSSYVGNANGCITTQCVAQGNALGGFFTTGSDANAGLYEACKSPANTGWGFYDTSLLGNTYNACETDLNTVGGYFGTNATPQVCTYISCYAEPNQPTLWSISNRSIRINPQGEPEAVTAAGKGVVMLGLPNNGVYFNRQIAWADNKDIADSNGGGASPGSMMRVDQRGYLYRHIGGKLTFAMQSGSQGIDFYYGTTRSSVVPDADLAATNIKLATPWFPLGITVGGAGLTGMDSGTAIPVSGTYQQGHIRFNTSAVASGFIGWVCITTGTPGTWKTFGAISA